MISLMYINLLVVRYTMIEIDALRMEAIVLTFPWWDQKDTIRKGIVLWSQNLNRVEE